MGEWDEDREGGNWKSAYIYIMRGKKENKRQYVY
jgi:hypothetical protein